MNKKIIFLFLALALPLLIFGFLKYFGKNKFDIPVYYKKGTADVAHECAPSTEGQYFVPDSLLTAIRWKGRAVLIGVGLDKTERSDIDQLVQRMHAADLQVADLDQFGPARLNGWKKCVLFLETPWKVVLIDDKKQIRGYYAPSTREEVDRLGIELDILLKRY